MKKNKLVLLMLLLVVFIFSGCAGSNALSVSFMDMTGAGSKDTTILVQYAEEKDYEKYYTELMVKSETENVTFQIRKELEPFVTVQIADANEYKSLTALLCVAQDKVGEETYVNYKEAVNTTWIIRCDENIKLTFKAVVGTRQDNAYGGELLTDKIDVSKEFEVDVEKYEE